MCHITLRQAIFYPSASMVSVMLITISGNGIGNAQLSRRIPLILRVSDSDAD
jgi:hypothetical protein